MHTIVNQVISLQHCHEKLNFNLLKFNFNKTMYKECIYGMCTKIKRNFPTKDGLFYFCVCAGVALKDKDYQELIIVKESV